MPQDEFKLFLGDLGLSGRTAVFNVTPVAMPILPFIWSLHKEDSDEYRDWLNKKVQLPHGSQFFVASTNKNLLNIKLRDYTVNGTSDIRIEDTSDVRDMNVTGGILDAIQATLELISASAFSNCPTIVLLTDLNKVWQFF